MKKDNTSLCPVYLPRNGKNDDSLFVGVNGRTMLIKKGIEVMVPPEIKEVIENSISAQADAEAYIGAAAEV